MLVDQLKKFAVVFLFILMASANALQASTLQTLAEDLATQPRQVDGIFINYGKKAYDWAYATNTGEYVAKLDGMDLASGYFVWNPLHSANGPLFDAVSVDASEKNVVFGEGLTSGEETSSILDAVTSLKNRAVEIAGYFIHYGTGAFDWVYVGADGSFAAKLEGISSETGYLQWSFLEGSGVDLFQNIIISDNGRYVTFVLNTDSVESSSSSETVVESSSSSEAAVESSSSSEETAESSSSSEDVASSETVVESSYSSEASIENSSSSEETVESSSSSSEASVCEVGNAAFHGQIKDFETGDAIAYARVEINGCTALAGEDGSFSLSNIAASEMSQVIVTRPGYIPTSIGRAIIEGQTNSAVISMVQYDQFEQSGVEPWALSADSQTITLSATAYAFNDTEGTLYSGTLNIDFRGYATAEISQLLLPSTCQCLTQAGTLQHSSTLAAFYFDVNDAYSQELSIAGADQVQVTFTQITSVEDEAIPLWHYDVALGQWVEQGTATKTETGTYQGNITASGLWMLAKTVDTLTTVKSNMVFPDGTPAANITLYAVADNWVSGETRTDADGHFELNILPGTDFRLMAYNNDTYTFALSQNISVQ